MGKSNDELERLKRLREWQSDRPGALDTGDRVCAGLVRGRPRARSVHTVSRQAAQNAQLVQRIFGGLCAFA
jgi:hypothetical protein